MTQDMLLGKLVLPFFQILFTRRANNRTQEHTPGTVVMFVRALTNVKMNSMDGKNQVVV